MMRLYARLDLCLQFGLLFGFMRQSDDFQMFQRFFKFLLVVELFDGDDPGAEAEVGLERPHHGGRGRAHPQHGGQVLEVTIEVIHAASAVTSLDVFGEKLGSVTDFVI